MRYLTSFAAIFFYCAPLLFPCAAVAGPAEQQAEPFVLGADISWIQEREAEGVRYRQRGESRNEDILDILRQNRFNYIRLRVFVDPTATVPEDPGPDNWGWSASPYSARGYCGLDSTVKYARRVKAAGFKFLLDFHYSDTWADPGKQWKPVSWRGLNFQQLTERVRSYTRETLEAFKDAGALPDMVQVGNEVVSGMIHPDGSTSGGNGWRNFATLVNAGINGVKDVDTSILIMMHTISERGPDGWVANLRTNLNAVESGAANRVDVIGLSYYPRWHGGLDSLQRVVNRIAGQTAHNYKIAVVEYADYHREVNDIVFALPANRRFGTFVWEPQEFSGDDSKPLFDWVGAGTGGRRETNRLMDLYPAMSFDYGNDDIDSNGTSSARYGIAASISGNAPIVTVSGRALRVSSPSGAALQIRVIDTRGRVRERFNAAGGGRFTLTRVTPGRYFVEITGAEGRRITPIVLLAGRE